MNEKDLNALIRMADEVDRLEEPTPLRFLGKATGSTREERMRRITTSLAGLAAAACLGLMAFVWLKPGSPVQSTAPQGPIAITNPETTPEIRTVVASAGEQQHSVLLTVFHDSEDHCSCIQLNQNAFRGRKLADVGSNELLKEALNSPCYENPERMLLIAMQGPKGSLPTTTDEAEVLAACVREGGSPRCEGEGFCLTNTAAPYLPEGVTVMSGTMGLR